MTATVIYDLDQPPRPRRTLPLVVVLVLLAVVAVAAVLVATAPLDVDAAGKRYRWPVACRGADEGVSCREAGPPVPSSAP